ncbi:MAG: hypothetical protein NDI61_00875 [Bdellovibrionaceae bacterium]|nr:hypothetical protein [Pseudobdellovibrionaceae bacterium]
MMKATDAILLTTGLTATDFSKTRVAHTRTRLLQAIRSARSRGLNPIVVLGPAGDDVLRICPELDDCDLAFDPNYAGELFSGILAGLQASQGACFVLPIESAQIDDSAWHRLDQAAWSLTPEDVVHVLQMTKSTDVEADAESALNFPQLITRSGVAHLRRLPADCLWDRDERIRFRCLPPETADSCATIVSTGASTVA